MLQSLSAVMSMLPPLGLGLGGTDGDASSTGGRGAVLGNYAKDGARQSNGLDTMQMAMLGAMALFAIVLLKKGE